MEFTFIHFAISFVLMHSFLFGAETTNGLKYIGAGMSSIGMFGAGVGQGYAAAKASEAVGRNPEAEAKIRNIMIVGAAIAESSALYALVIAILILFAS